MRLREGITFENSSKMVKDIIPILNEAYGNPVPFERMWRRKNDFAIMDCGVCWLYCWATTGSWTHNAKAIADSKKLFNILFNFSYLEFHSFVENDRGGYEWAQQTREDQNADYEEDLMIFLDTIRV
jgi:hypothetical protein